MTTKQAFIVLAAVHKLAKKMDIKDQERLFLDKLEAAISYELGEMPTLLQQQEAVADFFLELSRENT